jgi:antitoxin (DNA-binding transcriptional repressor) of toxin-antitoxin stability system
MSDTRVPVEDVQANFEEWLHRIEEGERIVITREGEAIARLTTVAREPVSPSSLPPLEEWRDSIDMKGRGLSATVRQQRKEERY